MEQLTTPNWTQPLLMRTDNQEKWKAHYWKLMTRAHNRDLEGYTESHHVFIKCMFPEDTMFGKLKNDIVVNLTPEEHYVAHQLLAKAFPEVKGVLFAAHMMGNTRHTNKSYGWLRLAHSNALATMMKGNKHLLGHKHTPETKERLRFTSTGYKHTPETIETLRSFNLGNTNGVGNKSHLGQTTSPETREKQRVGLLNNTNSLGHKHTEATKQRMSVSRTGTSWKINPETGKRVYYRKGE